jgi:hypothetical protein
MYCNFGATPSYSESPEERKDRLKKEAEEKKKREELEKEEMRKMIKWSCI